MYLFPSEGRVTDEAPSYAKYVKCCSALFYSLSPSLLVMRGRTPRWLLLPRRRWLFWWCFKFKILQPFRHSKSFSHSESCIKNIAIQNRRRVAAKEEYQRWDWQKNKTLRSRLISHIIIYIYTQTVIAIMVTKIIIVVCMRIFIRKMFSITTSSPIHTANIKFS